MKRLFKKLIPVLCTVPFVIGSIGYAAAGERITDSLYGSIALYGISPVLDSYNGYIEFARWTAPLVSATLILSVLSRIWTALIWRIKCLSKDSVAVYSDEEITVKFNKGTKAIYPGDELKKAAKSHILLFSSDSRNFDFYEKNKENFKGQVFLGLRELESGLVSETDKFTIFDINNSIARLLWKEVKIWNSFKSNVSIVIYGDSILSQQILSCGLLLNLYSSNQSISYHIISANGLFAVKHPELPLFNHDQIFYYSELDSTVWDIIRTADIVISADKQPVDMIQALAVNSLCGKVYYYSDSSSICENLKLTNLICFGTIADVFTDDNIRRQKLVETAKQLNKEYAVNYGGESNWNKLSEFLKNSNISSADFNDVIADLFDRVSSEELAELEHIRWCRFYYLNYWKQGVPTDGCIKDEKKRIHKNLIAFQELNEADKNKCRDVVSLALSKAKKKALDK